MAIRPSEKIVPCVFEKSPKWQKVTKSVNTVLMNTARAKTYFAANYEISPGLGGQPDFQGQAVNLLRFKMPLLLTRVK